MSLATRSLDEISRTVRGAFRQYLPGTDASLKNNVLTVIGKVVTLLAREYELRLAWIYDQLFLTTASSEAIVRLQAAELGIYQKPSAPASGQISGTAAANATYPAGIVWMSGGQSFVSITSFTADALGRFTATVRAEQAGSSTNRDAGATMTLGDAALWPDMTEVSEVSTDGLGGGADAENIDQLRARALRRKRASPQGGTLGDYEAFALEVPGVVAAWARQFDNGVGTIGAWVLFAGRVNGIPTQEDLDTVQTAIARRRLVRAEFHAVAPSPISVDLTIALSPDTASARAAVTAALTAFLDPLRSGSRIRPGLPGDAFTLPVAWISEAISTTPGEDSHRLIEPASDLLFGAGSMPVLGSITWA